MTNKTRRVIRRTCTAALVAFSLVAFPFTAAPGAVIVCSATGNATCNSAAESLWFATFGSLDKLAHEGRYGFSLDENHNIEPQDSVRIMRGH